ncbi:hypothetical protein D9M69_472660 [compost metagenome]
MAEEALVFRRDDGARQPAVIGQLGRRAAAGARAQHGLGAQPFDRELPDGRLHREGGVGQQQLRLQRQRAADAGALQLGQRRHQHGVPTGDGRVLHADVQLQVLRREAAGPGALQQGVAVGRLGRGLEGAGQRVAVAPHGGHQPLDLDRLRAQRRHVGAARRAAHLLLAGFLVPGEMHGAEAGVQRVAVQPRREPGRGGQAHRGGHADLERERAGLHRGAPFARRRRKGDLGDQEDGHQGGQDEGQQPEKHESQGLLHKHVLITSVLPR